MFVCAERCFLFCMQHSWTGAETVQQTAASAGMCAWSCEAAGCGLPICLAEHCVGVAFFNSCTVFVGTERCCCLVRLLEFGMLFNSLAYCLDRSLFSARLACCIAGDFCSISVSV